MFDSQWYPLNLYLIVNKKYIISFSILKRSKETVKKNKNIKMLRKKEKIPDQNTEIHAEKLSLQCKRVPL